MSENLNKKVAKLQELREGLKGFAEANPFSEMTAEIKSEWAERNNEVEELAEAVKSLQVMEKQQADNDAELEKGAEVKTLPIHNEVEKEAPKGLSAQIRESKAYNAFMKEGMLNISSEIKYNPFLETKTLVDEASAYPPKVVRSDLIYPTALRNPNAVIDLFSVIPTDQFQYKYLEETTFTNNGAEVAEGGAFGESALAFTERTENIRKFGVSIPVTEELLADVASVNGYLDSRLRNMLQLRLDSELLNGDGSAPNITGVLQKSGINTFDFSSYAGNLGRIGQLYQAITEIRKDAFLEADAIVMHPSDWNDIVTAVTSDFAGTSGAGYAGKDPLFVGAGMFGQGATPQIWGVRVVPTTAVSAGTVLVGVFGGGLASHIISREGMEVALSDSHSDFFTKDKVMMKASMRLGFAIYRATAFCSITNF
jgi:HK97 family phage major capsid protein